jgi:predicted RNA binding protein YcfA (HicA-like mRNA interferase family)
MQRERVAVVSEALLSSWAMKFSELVRLLEQEGFRLVKEKGSIRYYAKAGHPRLIRVDFHGAKEVPTGTCHAILKAAGVKRK